MKERAVNASAPDSDARVVTTHISHLFLVGDRAYKLKRPVKFAFLDFSTRELREATCHREVELNRRLAPDVYHRERSGRLAAATAARRVGEATGSYELGGASLMSSSAAFASRSKARSPSETTPTG